MRLWLPIVCAFCLTLGAHASPTVAAQGSGTPEAPTTTVRVASEAPVPQAAPPRIGPFRGGASGSGIRAAWWLLLLGGAQVIVLMLLTWRSRSRVPVEDDDP